MAIEEDEVPEHDGAAGVPSAELLDAVFKPVSESYYNDRVKSGGNARQRAQAAQSTVSLFVAGVIAAFSITALHDSATISRWAAAVAVCCWLASSVLYMRAVAAPLKDPIYDHRVKNQGDLVDTVLKHTIDEVRQIDRRQRLANVVAIAAIAATGVAFTTAVTMNVGPTTETGEIAVNPAYLATLRIICPSSGSTLRGDIETASVDQFFVVIQLAPAQCGGRAAQLYVPQDDVISLAAFGG